LVFSLLAMGISPAHAANEIRIVVTGPDADGITNIGYCFTDARALSGTVSFVATSSYGAFLAHSEMPNCPSMVGSSTGQRLTEGTTYAFTVTATNGGNTFTDSLNYTAPAQPAPRVTPTPMSTPSPESSTASTPSISETVTAPNSKVNVGIWLISGRTSEIYGRGDGVADSQSQIQWVTCLESLSGPMLYPNRDNLNYTYIVTGPAGVVSTGDYAPTWIDSMSSCTGNSGGNQYTVAYNLTGLAAGTSYQFTVTGSNAGTSFISSKSFTTMAAPSVLPTNPSTSVETKTATTPIVTPETSTPISTPTSSVAPVQVSDTATSSSVPAPSSVVTPAPAPAATPAPISAPAPTSETQSAVAPVVPIAPTSTSETDSGLDEVEAEEEIIDSIVAVVQSNGTTRIEVSTGYTLTAMTVVATKKGSKKKYTYKITTNADGDRKFKSGLNLRGYTVVLYKGSTELDRMYIS